MQPVLLFAVAACVAALPAAPPQAGARSLTAKAHEHAMVTIPTDEQAFAEYAEAVLQTMPAKVRHVLLTHFAACLDHHVALKGLDTAAATLSEHEAEALVSSAHACLRHARVNTPLVFKAALDAIVAFDGADAVATVRRLQGQPHQQEVAAVCAADAWLGVLVYVYANIAQFLSRPPKVMRALRVLWPLMPLGSALLTECDARVRAPAAP